MGLGVGKGIVGVGISVPGILRKADESSLKNDTTDGQMNMLIAHLDLVAIPFISESSSGGYEDDRAAGLKMEVWEATPKSKIQDLAARGRGAQEISFIE